MKKISSFFSHFYILMPQLQDVFVSFAGAVFLSLSLFSAAVSWKVTVKTSNPEI